MGRNRSASAGCAVAVVALLVAPSASQAAVDSIGSALVGTANVGLQDPQDTAYAQLAAPGGGQPTVLNSGQLVSVKVKGCSQDDHVRQDPETALFVQDLKPQSDGSSLVGSTSQRFHLPICGRNADLNTVSTFTPSNQCVSRGDVIGVVVGGQTPGYPKGTEYHIATNSPEGILGIFSANGGFSNGGKFTFAPRTGTELLMQAAIGSGADSPAGCAADPGGGGGGPAAPVAPTRQSVKLPRGAEVDPSRGRGNLDAVACTLASGDACRVSMVFTSPTGKKGKRVGTVTGSVAGGTSGPLTLRLNRAGKRKLRRTDRVSGVLRGTLTGKAGKIRISTKLTVTL